MNVLKGPSISASMMVVSRCGRSDAVTASRANLTLPSTSVSSAIVAHRTGTLDSWVDIGEGDCRYYNRQNRSDRSEL